MGKARGVPTAEFGALAYGGDGWTLRADAAALDLPQTPPVLALGNGFIGLRGPGGPAGEAKLYLNGVYERVPIAYHEAAHGYARESDTRFPAADPSGVAIGIDGAAVVWTDAELDLQRGILRLTAAADAAEVVLERVVAMRRNVIANRVRVTARRACRVTIAPSLLPPPTGATVEGGPYDPRIGPHSGAAVWTPLSAADTVRVDRLPRSGWTVATAIRGDRIDRTLDPGETIATTTAGAVVARQGDVSEQAAVALAATDVAELFAEQAAWFTQFWEAAAIELPDPAALALRHGLFQLIQAAGRDGRTSVAAKGQTGEGYEGHVFWDADSYVLPTMVMIAPAVARAMLAWRMSTLDAARANARAMGHARGALFAWRTIAGGECSSFFPAGSAQYHINADVAHALALYLDATGDESILAEGGAEMLAETARIWLQIGWHDPARGHAFVINRVTGPDEYSAIVDNNLYTNLMAQAHLRLAVRLCDLPADERAAMTRAADAMHVAWDAERDIPTQDERFFAMEEWPFAATPAEHYPLLIHYHPLTLYRHRVAKQADAVLAAATLPNAFDRDVRARMLDAYEAVTVHDSTLSASAFAIAAAGVGDAARAERYWRTSVLTDLADLFGNSGHGLHMAALAGGWNALAYGFAGMQVVGGLRFDPIAVPALGRYSFAVTYRGSHLRVTVDGDVTYRLASGPAVSFRHHGEACDVSPAAPSLTFAL